MKSFRREFIFELPSRTGIVNITPEVARCVEESKVKEGLCLVNSMHITGSVFINTDEQGFRKDLEEWLDGLAPQEPLIRYMHNETGDENADAHLKRQILGREVVVAITDGQLDLGIWEHILYGELDGRRKKRVLLKIIGE